MKPRWWNEWHDRALLALGGAWVRLGELRTATGLPANAFDDLVVAGYAVERRTDLLNHDRVVGQLIEFRVASPATAGREGQSGGEPDGRQLELGIDAAGDVLAESRPVRDTYDRTQCGVTDGETSQRLTALKAQE